MQRLNVLAAGQIDDALESGSGAERLRMIQIKIVEYNCVKLIPLIKTAHLAKECPAADRRQIEGLVQRQRSDAVVQQPPAQLRLWTSLSKF